MSEKVLTGVVLDERVELTVRELSRACSSSTEWVLQLVDEGVLEPRGRDRHELRFTGASLSRALTAARLQSDLGLNLPGVALVLEMMDEIESLRARLKRFADDDRDL